MNTEDFLKIATDAIIQSHFDRHRLTLPDTTEPEGLEQLSKWNETYRPYAETDAKTVLEAIGALPTSTGRCHHGQTTMRKQWRCFHCDTVFTNPHCAAIHFGADESATCACVLPHEQHLVNHIRDLEAQLTCYRQGDSDVMRSIYTLEADHRQALIRAEEEGYNKGVRDMMPKDAL